MDDTPVVDGATLEEAATAVDAGSDTVGDAVTSVSAEVDAGRSVVEVVEAAAIEEVLATESELTDATEL